MSSPQWPGQPGYPPGGQPPPPPGSFPPPGYPAPPPPPRGGGGAGVLIALLGGGAFFLVVIVAIVVIVVTNHDKHPRRNSSLPDYPSPSMSVPTPSASPTGLDSVLGPTIRTAKGNTFTQAGTKNASCSSRADKELSPVFNNYPCVGSMHSAVYANPSRTIITVISIAEFADRSSAQSVSDATNRGAAPVLLMPSIESGLPRLGREPESWTRSWEQGSRVVWAQSFWANGTATGGREGTVYVTAGELGTEVSSTLIWTD